MAMTRRMFLGLAGLWSALAAVRLSAAPAPAKAAAVPIDPAAFARALAQEVGSNRLAETDRIAIEVPMIAEDGALVPLSVDTTLPGVRELVILVEKNPTPVAARFKLDPALDPFVSLRIRVNESGDVLALANTAGGYFTARKRVEVVVGGCG